MLSDKSHPIAGYLSFTLHAHLPFVVNHGTWPHGMEWLHEAAAETYLLLLRALGRLQRDGIALHCNLNLSPILLEQLAHPVFQAEFPHYLERKITAAGEDEAFFLSTGEYHLADTARFWKDFFSQTLSQFESLGRDIISSFRFFNDAGLLDIITCCATHGYMPLLGTDESVRAQVRTAVDTHVRHLGKLPRGIWAPECGYRPAGPWNYPISHAADGAELRPFHRIGVEQALAESGLEFFFVDTHLVEDSARTRSPYDRHPLAQAAAEAAASGATDTRKLYQPYFVAGVHGSLPPVTVFPRDPRTGLQVWSGDSGYPGDASYLDFHKKRWPGGHRYWSVTGARVDMGDKQAYNIEAAGERTREHARHFVDLVRSALQPAMSAGSAPPVLCAPFDAELFGHWWFEGVEWLEAVAREVHASPDLQLISAAGYLNRHPRAGSISMPTGSWGSEGNDQVWLNADTSWTYAELYAAELFVRELAGTTLWCSAPLPRRLAAQICRELLLLESSDWQFLITTGAARDYAELRFTTHLDQFNLLRRFWSGLVLGRSLTDEDLDALRSIEERDSIFPDIDPGYWAPGARDARPFALTAAPEPNLPIVDLSSLHSAPGGDGPRMEVLKFNPET